MKGQTTITLAILSSLVMVAVPSANADTYTRTTTTEEPAPATHVYTSMRAERAPDSEASDTPLYADSLKTDNIIEKHRHHRIVGGLKYGKVL